MEYTEENNNKLSREIVESWDMDTLLNYAIEQLENFFKDNKEDFERQYDDLFGE